MSSKTILRRSWRMIVGVVVALSAAIVVLSFTPMMRPTNCGGNSAALAQVHRISSFARVSCIEHPDEWFAFTRLSEAQLRDAAHLARSHWTRSARFLVTTRELKAPVSERWVVAVCDTPYRNVPQRTFGLAPPAHAVAYSDGTTELISPEAYAALDHEGLVDLATFVGPKTD